MIVTVTANPAIDRLIELGEPLERGGVVRTTRTLDQPGGKGINVARVIAAAGQRTQAILPASPSDPLLQALQPAALDTVAVPIRRPVRVNLTLAESDGTTTKLNAPGAALDATELDLLTATVLDCARDARWLALCGSLPAGVPADWYADVARSVRGWGVKVAVDTSGAALEHVLDSAPDLIKPNADELIDLLGLDLEAHQIEADAALAGDFAQKLRVEHGIGAVLLTLGSAGALLATDSGTWVAGAPRIQARSTVGAGDSALAGYLIGAALPEPGRLALAIRHGSAAAAKAGTTPPTPADVAAIPPVIPAEARSTHHVPPHHR